jgi:cytochrome c oxidase subunit 2
VNKKVRLLITSNDVIHGWYVRSSASTSTASRGSSRTRGSRRQARHLPGQCSQICGKEHGYMPIVVEAKSEADYEKWLADTRARCPSPNPSRSPPRHPPPQPLRRRRAGAPAGKADGKTTYDTACFACHGTGAAGAPKLGDKAAWAPRIAQGSAALHAAALQGQGRDAAQGREHRIARRRP